MLLGNTSPVLHHTGSSLLTFAGHLMFYADEYRQDGQIILQGETQGTYGSLQFIIHFACGYSVSVCNFLIAHSLELVGHEDLTSQFGHLFDLFAADLQDFGAEYFIRVAAFDGVRVVIHDTSFLHQNLLVDGFFEIPVSAVFQALVFYGLVKIGLYLRFDIFPVVPYGGKAFMDNIPGRLSVAQVGVCASVQLLLITMKKLCERLAGQ